MGPGVQGRAAACPNENGSIINTFHSTHLGSAASTSINSSRSPPSCPPGSNLPLHFDLFLFHDGPIPRRAVLILSAIANRWHYPRPHPHVASTFGHQDTEPLELVVDGLRNIIPRFENISTISFTQTLSPRPFDPSLSNPFHHLERK